MPPFRRPSRRGPLVPTQTAAAVALAVASVPNVSSALVIPQSTLRDWRRLEPFQRVMDQARQALERLDEDAIRIVARRIEKIASLHFEDARERHARALLAMIEQATKKTTEAA